jgi:hypothetical protein
MVHLNGARLAAGPVGVLAAVALAALGVSPIAVASAPSGPPPCSDYGTGSGTGIETPCPAPDPVPGVFPQVECTSAAGTKYNAQFDTALQAYAPLHDNRFSFTRRDVRVAVLTADFKLSYYRAAVVKATGVFAHGRFTGWTALSGAPCGHRHKWSARYSSVSHFAPVP